MAFGKYFAHLPKHELTFKPSTKPLQTLFIMIRNMRIIRSLALSRRDHSLTFNQLRSQRWNWRKFRLEMLWSTFLLHHNFLLDACKQFYTHTPLEQCNIHIQIGTIDARLKTLESTIGNKALLLRGLPATWFTMSNLHWNILPHEE